MKRLPTLILFAGLAAAANAQEICVHKLLDKSVIANIEGSFINEQHSRARIDVEWRHHEQESLDTFTIHMDHGTKIRYITADTHRYIEQDSPKLKRQMGMHHLREDIGNTPIKYDDLELLAHGLFLCKDSSVQKPNIFSTAYSNTWWSMTSDTLPQPHLVSMRGAMKEKREIKINLWKDFSGITLPTLITIANPRYRGNIWIRSVYPMEDALTDPLLEKLQKSANRYRTLLWKGNEK